MTKGVRAPDRRTLLAASLGLIGMAALPGRGLAQPRSAALEDAIFEIIRLQPGYLKTPGISAAVILPDGDPLTVTDGLADPESGEAVTASTRFMSGSTGKTFCAATIMRLAEEGQLSLSDKTADLFGGEAWYDALPNAGSLTISHLLLHQGGFSQFLDMADFQTKLLWDSMRGKSIAYTPKEMLGLLAGKPALFEAGEGHHYSDLHYHLLGLVIEKVTGQSYYQALDALVIGRMSRFGDDILAANTTDLPGLAAGYAKGDILGRLSGMNGRTTQADGTLRNDPSLEYTGGGLALTPRALAQFYADLAQGRIVTSETFSEMVSASEAPPNSTHTPPYGYGLYVTEREGLGRYVTHSGFFPGYTSNVAFFLDHGVCVAIQQNSDHGPDLFTMLREVARAVLDHSE